MDGTSKHVEFRFICAHQHAGNLFVLGKVDDGGPLLLWSKPLTVSTREEAEKIGKALADVYKCPYGCADPWELKRDGSCIKPETNLTDVN